MPVIVKPTTRKSDEIYLSQFLEESKALRSAQHVVLEAVQGIGLFSASIDESPEPFEEDKTVASWSCIFELKNDLWIDIVLEAEMASALTAFQALTGSTSDSSSDAYDMLGEIVNFVRGGLKKCMSAEGGESLTPGTPTPVPGGNVSTINNYPCPKICIHLKCDELRLLATLLVHKQPPISKTLGMLRELDISMESIPTIQGSTLDILAKGVVLSKEWIEKLRSRFMKETKARRITVISPPAMTQLFHPDF